MLTRLDHVIHAVHDLASASVTYERLGFDVQAGGEHPRWGTHNSIVRFGLDYIEILALKDREVAEASGFRDGLLRYLDSGEGWVGYAVATDDAGAQARELAARGAQVDGPFPGQRRRPDGTLLEWRALGLGPPLARRLVPFMIEHLPSDAERLRQLESQSARAHPLGARRVRSVTIAVNGLDEAERVYGDELGLVASAREENSVLDAATACLPLGPDMLVLASPGSRGSIVSAELDRRGEGLFSVELEIEDLEAAIRHLRSAGFSIERAESTRTVYLDPDEIHGGRIALTEQ